jgi:tetratricopeptide (TPR) repeat protein
VTDTSLQRLAAPELHQALGTIALARGDAQSALDEFRRSDVAYDGLPSNECAPCIHFVIARAFDALGQPDSAIAEYQAYLAAPYFQKLLGGENGNIAFGDAMVLAGLHKRLGELYEAKGDRQKAAEHYVAFVALWKNADPELQPEVDDVRRRLTRLSDTEAKRN